MLTDGVLFGIYSLYRDKSKRYAISIMRKLLYLILVSTLIACGSRQTTDDCKSPNTIMDSISADPDGLIFWTADTIKETNMPLVLLMDSLYRFVWSDEFQSNNLTDNIRWMSNYRTQLSAYYDRNKMGEDTTPSFNKADSVIQSANKLWKLDDNFSTMGMIINNDTKRTRDVFTHYNDFLNLLDLCNSEESKRALMAEFEAWNNFEDAISDISANLIELRYCGGSGEGPASTAAYLKILDAHIQLYKKESDWVKHFGNFETMGVNPQLAKDLLIKCCQNAYVENYAHDYALRNEPYKKVAIGTKHSISQLSPIIDEWLEARSYWVSLNSSGWSKKFYNLNTGEVLLKLSNIICL